MNDSKPRALSRTWAAHVTYQECGVVTGHADYTVKLTRTPSGLVGEVDGAPCELISCNLNWFSPCGRGCSESAGLSTTIRLVFPMWAGMFRP